MKFIKLFILSTIFAISLAQIEVFPVYLKKTFYILNRDGVKDISGYGQSYYFKKINVKRSKDIYLTTNTNLNTVNNQPTSLYDTRSIEPESHLLKEPTQLSPHKRDRNVFINLQAELNINNDIIYLTKFQFSRVKPKVEKEKQFLPLSHSKQNKEKKSDSDEKNNLPDNGTLDIKSVKTKKISKKTTLTTPDVTLLIPRRISKKATLTNTPDNSPLIQRTNSAVTEKKRVLQRKKSYTPNSNKIENLRPSIMPLFDENKSREFDIVENKEKSERKVLKALRRRTIQPLGVLDQKKEFAKRLSMHEDLSLPEKLDDELEIEKNKVVRTRSLRPRSLSEHRNRYPIKENNSLKGESLTNNIIRLDEGVKDKIPLLMIKDIKSKSQDLINLETPSEKRENLVPIDKIDITISKIDNYRVKNKYQIKLFDVESHLSTARLKLYDICKMNIMLLDFIRPKEFKYKGFEYEVNDFAINILDQWKVYPEKLEVNDSINKFTELMSLEVTYNDKPLHQSLSKEYGIDMIFKRHDYIECSVGFIFKSKGPIVLFSLRGVFSNRFLLFLLKVKEKYLINYDTVQFDSEKHWRLKAGVYKKDKSKKNSFKMAYNSLNDPELVDLMSKGFIGISSEN
jgi:hypothetical protein